MPQLDPDKQRQFAVEVVATLRAAGQQAYWAGGCVRDHLLGRRPKDYDVATDAPPDRIREIFGKRRTLPLGAAFGVITVLGAKEAGQIEVATFREDAAYSDGRRPDAVTFSTPEADAQRRDFTINGLFFDPVAEDVIDFVGGRRDLEQKLLRAIGDPALRIAEDKLRMLRAARMAAMLEFALDPATAEAIRRMASELPVVSVERIAAELRLMLVDRHRRRAVELLRELGLLSVIFPEIPLDQVTPDAWAASLSVLGAIARPSFEVALVALLGDLVDRAKLTDIGRRLKFSNREIERSTWLLAHRGETLKAIQMPWSKLQRLLISDGIGDLLTLDEATAQALGHDLAGVEHCRKLLSLPPEELNPSPLISGDDLAAHGVPRGRIYQTLLEQVRDAQLEKQIHTKAEAIKLVDHLLGDKSS